METDHKTLKLTDIKIEPDYSFNTDKLSKDLLQDDRLPMVMTLTGHESFFDEFDLSADEAMDTLGIKRSRLNQISGKELRVGRAKIDRYVRPIYRSKDVEEYLSWSRVTATHKKSKDAIDSASKNLESYAKQLADSLSEDSGHLSQSMDQHLLKLNQQLDFSLRKYQNTNRLHLTQLRSDIQTLETTRAERTNHIKNEITKTFNSISELNESVTQFDSAINFLIGEITNIKTQIAHVEHIFEKISTDLHNNMQSVRKSQDMIEQKVTFFEDNIAELSTQIKEDKKAIAESINKLSEKVEVQKKCGFQKFKANRKKRIKK